jgi:hypothetical protein
MIPGIRMNKKSLTVPLPVAVSVESNELVGSKE